MSESFPVPEIWGRVSTHPGKILANFLSEENYNLTAKKFARRIGVPVVKINRVLACRDRVDANLALRLGRVFGTTVQFWTGLQSFHELTKTNRRIKSKLDLIEPLPTPVMTTD